MKSTSTNMLSNCNSLTAAATIDQTGPPKNFATRLWTATLHASMREKMKRVGISLAMGLLAAILGAGFANAQVVAVTNAQFPMGGALPGGDTLKTGCETETAQETIIDTAGTYTFLFWNVNGSVQWSQTATFCTGATNGFATAWYVLNGDGNCTPPNCSVRTFGFDLKDNVALPVADGTPIGLVSPNLQPNGTPAWTSPSVYVLNGQVLLSGSPFCRPTISVLADGAVSSDDTADAAHTDRRGFSGGCKRDIVGGCILWTRSLPDPA